MSMARPGGAEGVTVEMMDHAGQRRGLVSKPDTDRSPGPEPDATPEQSVSDTSTDWDEWMEKQGPRPQPVSDIADAEGKFQP